MHREKEGANFHSEIDNATSVIVLKFYLFNLLTVPKEMGFDPYHLCTKKGRGLEVLSILLVSVFCGSKTVAGKVLQSRPWT